MNYYFNNMPIVAPFSIQSNEPQFETDTLSLKHYRTSQNAQRWELSFMLRSSREVRHDLVARIVNYNTPRTMIMPQLTDVLDNSNLPSSDLLVSAQANAGEDILNVSLEGGASISKGYFIRFSNHSKIYMITNDISSGTSLVVSGDYKVGSVLTASISGGAAQIKQMGIYPTLRQTVPAGTKVLLGDEVLFRYYMKGTSLRGVVYEDGMLADAGVMELFEAL